jgi:hypothetical protein
MFLFVCCLILLFFQCIYIQDTFSQITILNCSFVLLHVTLRNILKKEANARTLATQLNIYGQMYMNIYAQVKNWRFGFY